MFSDSEYFSSEDSESSLFFSDPGISPSSDFCPLLLATLLLLECLSEAPVVIGDGDLNVRLSCPLMSSLRPGEGLVCLVSRPLCLFGGLTTITLMS